MTSRNPRHFLVIMAGGIGSRFWPDSRSARPKQFLDLIGAGQSLIQMTWDRFSPMFAPENIFVVTHQRYFDLVREHLPALPPANILLEPVGRNTAPCIEFAALRIRGICPDAVLFITSSDQYVREEDKLRTLVHFGLEECGRKDIIMTLGIKPTRPDTGYGYIQHLDDTDPTGHYHKVKTFTEKPDIEVAKFFVQSGEFLWNSGMFVFSVNTLLEAFQKFLPDMHEQFLSIVEDIGTPREAAAIEKVYSKTLNISIDYGILEKAPNVYVMPAAIMWSDLGTWSSAYEFSRERDYLKNVVQGKVIVFDSAGNFVKSSNPDKVVVLEGLDDFIVIDAPDVLLICRRDKEQMVREISAEVRKQYGEKYV